MKAKYPFRSILLAFAILSIAIAAAAQDPPERVASRIDFTDPDDATAERDRQFARAQQLADNDQWAEAVKAAQAALDLERRQHPTLETNEACPILQYLAVWQQLAGDYPAAVATMEQLLATCTKVSGPQHWLTKTTQIDLAECARDAARNAAERRQLVEANRCEMQALRLQAVGKFQLALESATKAMEIREQVAGLDDACGSEVLNSVGAAYVALGKHSDAQPYLERAIAIRLRLFGLENPATLTTLQSLSIVRMAAGDHKETQDALEKVLAGSGEVYGPAHPATCRAALELATFFMSRGDVARAEPVIAEMLKKQIGGLGENNLDVVRSRIRIGQMYARTGDHKAQQYLDDAVASLRALNATSSVEMATALAALGQLEYFETNYEPAKKHCSESLEIYDQTTGLNEPAAIDTLVCLAMSHKAQGDTGQAARLLEKASDRYAQVYGEQHAKTAEVLTQLGALYQTLNNNSRAEECLRRAVKIDRAVLGDAHPDTLNTMLTIANLETIMGRIDQAEQQMRDVLALAETNLGPDDDMTQSALLMLGNLYYVERKYDESDRALRALWTSRKKRFPDQTYANSLILQSLVETLIKKENYQEAAQWGEEVLQASTKHLSDFDPNWTVPLQSTALAYYALGRYEEARDNVRRSIEITYRLHDAASIAQSEQQQIRMSVQQRGAVNLYLSLPQTYVSAEDAYAVVLQRKGAIHARQVRDRRNLGPAQQPIVDELQQVSTQLATLSLRVPEPAGRDDWLVQIRDLKDRKVDLETRLATSIRDSQTHAEPAPVTPDRLRAVLPADTALIDLFIYVHTSFDNSSGQPQLQRAIRVNAFIVRRDQPVQRIDLGERMPIEDLVEAWRTKSRYAVDAASDKSAAALRKQVWEPLRPYLEGCHTLLFSPDGKLARFPLGALPGDRPGSFLLEDFAIAVVPVPQLLPDMLDANSSNPSINPNGLLLIGDVDYDASSDETSDARLAGGELATFPRLKSTGPEIHSLADLYRRHAPGARLLLLERGDATEAAFRHEGPAYSTLVVATHGFYAPSGISSALSAQNRAPDLGGSDGADEYCETLSGLALAGANRGSVGDNDDGILTATEVSALDLRNLDLAVLSGCETALGAVSDGEGALGLQRAFLKAGTRSTISSLWTVPDRRTSQLMQRFHSNRWDRGMSKLDALREAQLWMLRTGGKEPSSDDPEPPRRLAPYYWAAFVLSGDWR